MSDDTQQFDLSSTDIDPIVQLVYNNAIRRTTVNGTNYYSLVDFVGYFSDTKQSHRQYWNDVKQSMIVRYGFQASDQIRQLRLPAKDGKMRLTDCGDIVTIKRVVMSIPSAKAEPLRMWIAGRKEDAYLNYDHQNVIEGKAWAADVIRKDNQDLDPPDQLSAWEEMGYLP